MTQTQTHKAIKKIGGLNAGLILYLSLISSYTLLENIHTSPPNLPHDLLVHTSKPVVGRVGWSVYTSESESESSLLAKYISTYKEFFLGLIALNVLKLKNMHATV